MALEVMIRIARDRLEGARRDDIHRNAQSERRRQ
jgi:hypothetical protein